MIKAKFDSFWLNVSQVRRWPDRNWQAQDRPGWGSRIVGSFEGALHQHGLQVVSTPYLAADERFDASLRKQMEHLGTELAGVLWAA